MTYLSLAEVKAVKLGELRELRAEHEHRERERLANLDVFDLIGYEPTCKPRFMARARGDVIIPEPCGQCPQERFHAATEADVLYGGAAGGGKVPPSWPRASAHAPGTQGFVFCWCAAPMTN